MPVPSRYRAVLGPSGTSGAECLRWSVGTTIFRSTIACVDIHASARKHGVADEDIEHATRNAMTIEDLDDHLRLYLGSARNAGLLEVVTIVRTDASELAIHAMAMRAKYRPLLPEA